MKAHAIVGTMVLLVATQAYALTPKDVYKKCGQAVVLILGSDDGKAGSGGTGSIITPEGKIVTNAHVVVSHDTGRPFKILYVFLKPDHLTGDNSKDLTRRYKAKVTAFSPPDELDLALVELDGAPAPLPTIAFADPDKVDVGDEVVAIGHPEQGGLWTLTTGAISTVIANYGRVQGKNVFQTEASVNRGNSGGPLLDSEGNMVGINTMIARQAADGVAITAVNFSLKSSVAVSWLAVQGMGLAYVPKADAAVTVALAPQAPAAQQGSTGTPAAGAGSAAHPSGTATVATSSNGGSTGSATTVATSSAAEGGGSAAGGNTQVAQKPPPATIVVAQAPPPKTEDVKALAKNVTKEGKESLVKGKPLDMAKAKPKYVTEKRPFNIDDLRKQQMKELEDMMDEMSHRSGKQRGKGGDGMGLW